jgi:hypothetical protein
MKIAVYDPDDVNIRPWEAFLAGHEVHFVTSLTDKLEQDHCVAFAHGSYLNAEIVATFQKTNPAIPFVVVSGGDQAVWWHDGLLNYWRKQPVRKQMDSGFSACCSEFLRQLELRPSSPRFSLLDPSNEAVLAFRLLCEVKQMCGDSPTKEFNGIKINAPMSIEQWLAPFGKSQASEIGDVANLIGSEKVGAKAKVVLEAANGGGNLNQAIREFLEVPTTQLAKG